MVAPKEPTRPEFSGEAWWLTPWWGPSCSEAASELALCLLGASVGPQGTHAHLLQLRTL